MFPNCLSTHLDSQILVYQSVTADTYQCDKRALSDYPYMDVARARSAPVCDQDQDQDQDQVGASVHLDYTSNVQRAGAGNASK